MLSEYSAIDKSPPLVSVDAESSERRTGQRHMSILRIGKLITARGQELCLIRNISVGGLMAHIYSGHEMDEHVAIELKSGHVVSGRIVWVREKLIGVEFDSKIDVFGVLANPSGENGSHAARAPRLDIRCHARARVGAHYHRIEVCDISQGGAKILPGDIAPVGAEIIIMIEGFAPWPGIVRWQEDGRAGVAFRTPLPLNQFAIWATLPHS